MAFLEINDLRKSFGPLHVVQNFELAVERGEFVSFLGPSGCGKTTTLRMVAGFERPSAGAIRINGQEMTGLRPNQRNVGMVFQSYALFPNMTVAENVGFGLKVAKRPAAEVRARVEEMLELIRLPTLAGRYPYQLSGGQQQRVALARAIAIKPQVLLLDEPLSALDAKIRVSLREEIKTVQRELGITTIYVTHDQEEALSMSDRIVVMNEGRVEQIGTPFEVYNYPRALRRLVCRHAQHPAREGDRRRARLDRHRRSGNRRAARHRRRQDRRKPSGGAASRGDIAGGSRRRTQPDARHYRRCEFSRLGHAHSRAFRHERDLPRYFQQPERRPPATRAAGHRRVRP
jgi:ABC-type sugar transport system ATPase subunit